MGWGPAARAVEGSPKASSRDEVGCLHSKGTAGRTSEERLGGGGCPEGGVRRDGADVSLLVGCSPGPLGLAAVSRPDGAVCVPPVAAVGPAFLRCHCACLLPNGGLCKPLGEEREAILSAAAPLRFPGSRVGTD